MSKNFVGIKKGDTIRFVTRSSVCKVVERTVKGVGGNNCLVNFGGFPGYFVENLEILSVKRYQGGR